MKKGVLFLFSIVSLTFINQQAEAFPGQRFIENKIERGKEMVMNAWENRPRNEWTGALATVVDQLNPATRLYCVGSSMVFPTPMMIAGVNGGVDLCVRPDKKNMIFLMVRAGMALGGAAGIEGNLSALSCNTTSPGGFYIYGGAETGIPVIPLAPDFRMTFMVSPTENPLQANSRHRPQGLSGQDQVISYCLHKELSAGFDLELPVSGHVGVKALIPLPFFKPRLGNIYFGQTEEEFFANNKDRILETASKLSEEDKEELMEVLEDSLREQEVDGEATSADELEEELNEE